MTIEQLNEASPETLRKALRACCGSQAWTKAMAKHRPYPDLATLQKIAAELWLSLNEFDWLEAFAAHPKIGEKQAAAKWSDDEQSGMSEAAEHTTTAIGRLNEEYERKFEWIFIVCATGKSAAEMQAILETRLQNAREIELPLAAAEQLKITHLRLAKLVAE